MMKLQSDYLHRNNEGAQNNGEPEIYLRKHSPGPISKMMYQRKLRFSDRELSGMAVQLSEEVAESLF